MSHKMSPVAGVFKSMNLILNVIVQFSKGRGGRDTLCLGVPLCFGMHMVADTRGPVYWSDEIE